MALYKAVVLPCRCRACYRTTEAQPKIALARKTPIHEWRRFVPSVFAVGFFGRSAGPCRPPLCFWASSALPRSPRDGFSADLWVGYPGTQSVNFRRNIGSDGRCVCAWDPSGCGGRGIPMSGSMATGARAPVAQGATGGGLGLSFGRQHCGQLHDVHQGAHLLAATTCCASPVP